MNLRECPECEYEIIDKIGTICPKCGHTIGYFEGDEKRKKYGKFFAINVFLPFISFLTIVFLSFSISTLLVASIIFMIISFYSCPIRFKDLLSTTYEKIFFGGIWILVNTLLLTMLINLFNKLS